jgi:transcriptional regulator with XRE-family HTH domain
MEAKGIHLAKALKTFYRIEKSGKTIFRNHMIRTQVAVAMGVAASEVTRALNGERPFTKDKLERFFDLMGATVAERDLCLEELYKDIFGLDEVERMKATLYLPIFWEQYRYLQKMRKSGYPQQADNLAGPAITWIEGTLQEVKSQANRKPLLEVLAWTILERIIEKREYLSRTASQPATNRLLLRLDEIAREVKEIKDDHLYEEIMGLVAFAVADMTYLLAGNRTGPSGIGGLYNLGGMTGNRGPRSGSQIDLYWSSIQWHNSALAHLLKLPTTNRFETDNFDLLAESFNLRIESMRQQVISYGAVGDLARLRTAEHRIEEMLALGIVLPDQHCALDEALARGYTNLSMAIAARHLTDDASGETEQSLADKAFGRIEQTREVLTNGGQEIAFIRKIQYHITLMKWLQGFSPSERNYLDEIADNALELAKEFGSIRYEGEINEMRS